MIRAVLDTNVLVSAAITPKGHSDQILTLAEANVFTWLTSAFILAEPGNVLVRKHIQIKYRLQVTPQMRERYLAAIREFAEVVQAETPVVAVSEDPKDNAILACGKDGQAGYVVTGDPHLLRLGSFEGIRIVTPAEFLKILEEENPNLHPSSFRLHP